MPQESMRNLFFNLTKNKSMAEKTRYSDEELEEFRQIINDKLALARRELSIMMGQLNNSEDRKSVV